MAVSAEEHQGGSSSSAPPATVSYRHVHSDASRNGGFCSNIVTTSKYTAVTFLPIFLFEEFSRVYPAEVCGWGGPGSKTIVLMDGAIKVPPPYTGEAVEATSATLKDRVLKLVQTVHQRKKEGF